MGSVDVADGSGTGADDDAKEGGDELFVPSGSENEIGLDDDALGDGGSDDGGGGGNGTGDGDDDGDGDSDDEEDDAISC